MQWDFHWNLGTFLGILELTWPPMAQARGGLGVSKMCCSRGLVSHLIGGTGIAMVKPEQRERHTHTRDTCTEARESEEGQGGKKSPRGEESGGETGGQGKKGEEKKGEPDVRTTNTNLHLEQRPNMIGSRGWWPRLIGLQYCGGQVEGLGLMSVLACGWK